ncbi:hypothetical protein BCS42_01590 [Crenothrix sp. D3]|nr:hypothetical protein BCS42_01590 [Crenothrix sp. D3]
MKLLITLMLVIISGIAHSSDIEGDTNNDGILSGSEQYLFNNSLSINLSRERITEIIRKLRIQKQIQEQEQASIVARNYLWQQKSSSSSGDDRQTRLLNAQERVIKEQQAKLDAQQKQTAQNHSYSQVQPTSAPYVQPTPAPYVQPTPAPYVQQPQEGNASRWRLAR